MTCPGSNTLSDLALLEDTAARSGLVLDPALEHCGESGAESGMDDDPDDGLDDLGAGDFSF